MATSIAVYTGTRDLGELEESGWVHHDKMASIYDKSGLNWLNGEFKSCESLNGAEGKVIIYAMFEP